MKSSLHVKLIQYCRFGSELNAGARQGRIISGPPRSPTQCTLADLDDPVTMPPHLAKGHAELDRAVDRCYRREPFDNDRARVEHLFQLYEKLTAPLAATEKKPRRKRKTKEES